MIYDDRQAPPHLTRALAIEKIAKRRIRERTAKLRAEKPKRRRAKRAASAPRS